MNKEVETVSEEQKQPHQGNNVRFFRVAIGMKQDTLANMIGKPQSSIPSLEKKPILDEDTLKKCAEALGVSVEALKTFEPETALQNITYNIEKVDNSHVGHVRVEDIISHYYPIEKIMELNKQNTELYERMLKAELEKNAMLEKRIAELQAK